MNVTWPRHPIPSHIHYLPDIIRHFLRRANRTGKEKGAGRFRPAPSLFAYSAYAAFDRAARLRSFGSRKRLRRRIDFGVTSTISSSSI